MGNVSECSQCHVQGTNFAQKCGAQDHKGNSDAYLFNLRFCVPSMPNGELLSVPDADKSEYECFSCCFEKMVLDTKSTTLPYAYIYKSLKAEEAHCITCKKTTNWSSFSQNRQIADGKGGIKVDD